MFLSYADISFVRVISVCIVINSQRFCAYINILFNFTHFVKHIHILCSAIWTERACSDMRVQAEALKGEIKETATSVKGKLQLPISDKEKNGNLHAKITYILTVKTFNNPRPPNVDHLARHCSQSPRSFMKSNLF